MEATAKQALAPETCGGQEWIEQELAGLTLLDAQLGGYLVVAEISYKHHNINDIRS
jgi:hypothetical protein